jgi:Glycosyltransferases involved in cell wall biogenesis
MVGDVVRGSREFLPDVVVVDDGSTDRTGDESREAGAVVLRHDVNRGKGAALKTGFAWALERGYDAVVTLDADRQHLPADIPKFLAESESSHAHLIIGSRRHLFAGMLPRRRLANRFSAWGISIAAKARILDSQSGFRLYSRELLQSVRLEANGFDAESEVIVRAGRLGMSVVMIPIDLGFVNGVSTSHYRPIVDTVRIALRVAKTALWG